MTDSQRSRIGPALEARLAAGGTALVPFITAGDPNLKATEKMIVACAEAGADVVELGVPFSDPLADGPTIQKSSVRALASGTTLSGILDTVARARRKTDVPIVLMGYSNPFLSMPAPRLARKAAEAGVDGVIVPDMPPEEGGELFGALRAEGIDTILLVAPTTPDDRVERIGRETSGFLYYVSLTGVTGARTRIGADVPRRVRRVRRLVDVPVLVGFGISTPAQAAEVGRFADGVIVGSAVVNQVEGPGGAAGAVRRVGKFVASLRRGLDRAR